jgi:hypothetical protein
VAVIDEPTTLAAYWWLPALVLLVPFVCLLARSPVLNLTLAFATAGAALGFLIGSAPDGDNMAHGMSLGIAIGGTSGALIALAAWRREPVRAGRGALVAGALAATIIGAGAALALHFLTPTWLYGPPDTRAGQIVVLTLANGVLFALLLLTLARKAPTTGPVRTTTERAGTPSPRATPGSRREP